MFQLLRFASLTKDTKPNEPIKSSSLFWRPWTWIFSVIEFALNTIDLIRLVIHTLFNWTPTSPFVLEEVEQKFISHLKYPGNGYFVDIGSGWNLDSNFIWTMEFSYGDSNNVKPEMLEMSEPAPLVLLHGLGTGSAIWALNTDHLIQNSNRKIYAIDLLGFGRSSRPEFDLKGDVEWQLVYSIEKWRRAIKLNRRFVLLGHGFGAYLSVAYALNFPQQVAHLMLVDAWGLHSTMQQQQQLIRTTSYYPLPYWVNLVNNYVLQRFSPTKWLKAAGPWGLQIITTFRTDFPFKYEKFLGPNDAHLIVEYIYHCNVQPASTGEDAFKALCTKNGWPICPIIHRVRELSRRVRLTFVFGSRSWIDRQPAYQIKYLLGDSRVSVHIVQGSGHHVYADRPDLFNQILCDTLQSVDDLLRNPPSDSSSDEATDESDTYTDYEYRQSDEEDISDKDEEEIVD